MFNSVASLVSYFYLVNNNLYGWNGWAELLPHIPTTLCTVCTHELQDELRFSFVVCFNELKSKASKQAYNRMSTRDDKWNDEMRYENCVEQQRKWKKLKKKLYRRELRMRWRGRRWQRRPRWWWKSFKEKNFNENENEKEKEFKKYGKEERTRMRMELTRSWIRMTLTKSLVCYVI